jgi:pyrimidine-specific ribonucleoside hydrolase
MRTLWIGALLVSSIAISCGGAPKDDGTPPEPTILTDASPSPIAVWMDVDPAVMRGGHEPDDGLALLQAFHSRELEVRGIGVVFGNSALETGFPIAREIAERYGPSEVAVHRGASSAAELGVETDASRALAEALRSERLTVLALGPVTNVATTLGNHPDLAERIDEIVAVAGRRPGQRFTIGEGGRPLMDLNFEYDSQGFQILLDSGAPIVLAPFEISSKVPLSDEDIERFSTVPEIAELYLEPLRDYVDWYEEHFRVRAIFPFDTLAVGYLATPDWIQCETLPVEIRTMPDDIQEDREKPYLLVAPEIDSANEVTYCHTAAQPFKDDLIRRMLDLG